MSCSSRRIPLVVVCGPTASGKTALSIEMAKHFPLEVVSADSRQVYRGMDIGTAKVSRAERDLVPHHLIDVVGPEEGFSTADFVRLAKAAIEDIDSRGRRPWVVGGTGLYIQNLTEGLVTAPPADAGLRAELRAIEEGEGEGTLYRRLQEVDPEIAARLPGGDLVRIIRALEVFYLCGKTLSSLQADHGFREHPYRLCKIGIAPEREELYRLIDLRVEMMFAAGLVEEVENLLHRGSTAELKAMQTIGYRETLRYLAGELSREEAIALIQRESRRYAKRQLTWFRRDNSIIWVDSLRESGRIQAFIDDFYAE